MRHTEPRNPNVHSGPQAAILLSLVMLAAAPAGAAPGTSQPIELDRVGAGELLWRSDAGLVPLPAVDVDVELSVVGLMTRARIQQRFHNPTAEVIEALYVFPLPERAALHRMEMRIGERRIVSTIREKDAARQTYELAKATGRKAALVDQHRPNLFTTAAANINPGESIDVVLAYYEEARMADGRFELRVPLSFTPRFDARTAGAAEPAAVRARAALPAGRSMVPRASIRVELRTGFGVERVSSESHDILVNASGDRAEVRTRGTVAGDRDFLLSWKAAPAAEPRSAVFVEERDGARYVLVMIMPPSPQSDDGLGLPTETLFILDVSGSMAGPSMTQARQALLAALERMRPEDRFNILAFNDTQYTFREEFVQAEPEQLETAGDWVHRLKAGGGTMIYPALMRGLAAMGQSRSAHAQRIVFLTDGAVAQEDELFRALVERLGAVRLHTIGIGAAPNTHLMRKMAELGRGLCEFVSTPSHAENRIASFLERLDRPMMEDVRLDGADALLREIYPARLPDLYAGEPLLLSARLDAAGSAASLSLGGYTRAGWLSGEAVIHDAVPAGAGVALRWARVKVESLMDSLLEGADEAAVRSEVVDLALGFNLVTRYTSLVAVDDSPTAVDEAQPARLAAVLPQGGTDGPLRAWLGALLAAVGLAWLAVLWLRVPR